jgi:hypothetical protein
MAKLPPETLEAIWTLLKQLSHVVEDAGEAEFNLVDRFGETDSTLAYLDELKGVSLDAATRYSQLCNIRLRIAEAQPTTSVDMLRLLEQVITRNQLRVPAMERSIEEIKMEWTLP